MLEPMEPSIKARLRGWRWVGMVVRDWARMRPLPLFVPLADATRRCIFFALREASTFSCREITTEHLLLGILREEPSLVSAAGLATVVGTIAAGESPRRSVPPGENPELSGGAKRAIAAAWRTVKSAGRREVLPADLARGILREDTLAARLLREHIPGRS